jgi:hypothetical protein
MKLNYLPSVVLCCVFLLGLSSAQTVPGATRGGLLPPASSALNPARTQDPAASVIDFGTMDFPTSPASGAYGINDNEQIVGAYGPDLGPDIGDAGFILSNGSLWRWQFPGYIRARIRFERR